MPVSHAVHIGEMLLPDAHTVHIVEGLPVTHILIFGEM